MSFAEENNEAGPYRIGEMYAPVNFGVIGIDWEAGALALQIKDEAGVVVREQAVSLDEIGAR
jgi:alkaline phosphatase D